MVKGSAQRMILKSSNGRKYGRHTASRAGDAPNKDTGELIRNIRVSAGKGNIKKGYSATVRAVTPYAMRLEYGGKDKRGVYIAPRPFMRPALAANQDKINKLVLNAIRSAIDN
jgi:hypothetical protein